MADRIVRVVLRGEVAGFSQAMATAKAGVVSTAGAMTAANKEGEKFRKGLTTLGTQAGKIGLIAGAGLAIAIKSATDFNSELALVQTLSHATAADMDKLSHAALTVGQNIGYSAKAVAQGEEELIKAGVSVKDILGGGLKGALDLAAAGQTDVATATSIAASALTQFSLAGKDVPHVADLLAAGADKALGSVEDLGFGLSQAGTTAHQMGFSIEQTVGVLTAFAQAGILGEKGGTTFKQMLLKLSAPAASTADLMKKLGISLYDASGNIKTLPALADNLRRSLEGLTPAQRNAALGTIFGARAIQGANVLIQQGATGIQGYIDKVNDQGFAAQQAAGKLNSLGGDVKKLGTELNAAFIGTGNGSQGPLRVMTQDATKAVAAFNKLPAPIKGVSGDLLALVAITGGSLWFGSRVIKSISDTRLALEGLQITAGTTRVALANIGKGAAFVGLATVLTQLTNELGHNFDNSDLQRNLTAVAAGTDTVSKKFKGLAGDIQYSNSKIAKAGDPVDKLAKGILTVGTLGFVNIPDTPLEKAQHNIKAVDEALAAMVESGNADQAAVAFDRISKAAKDNGSSLDDVKKDFSSYETAIADLGSKTDQIRTKQKLLSGDFLLGAFAQSKATIVARNHTAAVEANAKALATNRAIAYKTAQGFITLGADVDNAKVSLDKWIRQRAAEAKALSEFADNAVKAGKRGLRDGLVKELEQAGPQGALRLKQLASASQTEIHKANQVFDDGRVAVKKYTDLVGGVKPVTVDVKTGKALTAVQELTNLLTSLDGRDIHIKATVSTNATVAEAGVVSEHTKGGRRLFWSGGYTGDGNPFAKAGDVHHREMVFEDAATRGHEAQLDLMRRSLAAGKSFSVAAASVSGGSGAGAPIDYDRLAALMSAASPRPLIGHQTVMAQDFQEWQRKQAELAWHASTSGVES